MKKNYLIKVAALALIVTLQLAAAVQPAVAASNYTLTYINDRNSLYSANSYNGTPGYSNDTYSILSNPGTRVKALISAPHAVKQVRNGEIKAADAHTGGMARILGQTGEGDAKAFVVTNVYNNPNNPRDPNYDPYSTCSYTQEIVDVINNNDIKFVLDIHGAAASQPFAVAIGTNYDSTINNRTDIRDAIIEVAARHGFTDGLLDYNSTFPASNPNTVVRKVHAQTGIPAIQIEINGQYRLQSGGTVADYNGMLDFLIELVQELDGIIE